MQVQVLGDIMFPRIPTCTAPKVFLTPGYFPRTADGFRKDQSLWSAGTLLIEVTGLPAPEDGYGQLVAELYPVVKATFPANLTWANGACTVDLSGLLGQPTAQLCDFIRETYGRTCTAWLPYADINYLRLFDERGTLVRRHIYKRSRGTTDSLVRNQVSYNITGTDSFQLQFTGRSQDGAIRKLLIT